MRASAALCCLLAIFLSGCINRAGADMTACRMARVACESRTKQLQGDLASARKAHAPAELPPDGHARVDDRKGMGLDVTRYTSFSLDGSKEQAGLTVPLDDKHHLSVSRRVAAAMQYDGAAGVNVITIRRHAGQPGSAGSRRGRELYSAALLGQYPLAGYYGKERVLLALSVEQVGAMPHVRGLVGIHTRGRRLHTIGPRGAFQYASVSPDGRHAVLVDNQVVVVDIVKGLSHVVPGASVKAVASPGKGNDVGGGHDLSGKHLRFTWSGAGGELVGTDASGKEVDRIKVIVTPASLAMPKDRPPR